MPHCKKTNVEQTPYMYEEQTFAERLSNLSKDYIVSKSEGEESNTKVQLIKTEYSYARFKPTLFAQTHPSSNDHGYEIIEKSEVDQGKVSKPASCSIM